jgi:hypothetical protein
MMGGWIMRFEISQKAADYLAERNEKCIKISFIPGETSAC